MRLSHHTLLRVGAPRRRDQPHKNPETDVRSVRSVRSVRASCARTRTRRSSRTLRTSRNTSPLSRRARRTVTRHAARRSQPTAGPGSTWQAALCHRADARVGEKVERVALCQVELGLQPKKERKPAKRIEPARARHSQSNDGAIRTKINARTQRPRSPTRAGETKRLARLRRRTAKQTSESEKHRASCVGSTVLVTNVSDPISKRSVLLRRLGRRRGARVGRAAAGAEHRQFGQQHSLLVRHRVELPPPPSRPAAAAVAAAAGHARATGACRRARRCRRPHHSARRRASAARRHRAVDRPAGRPDQSLFGFGFGERRLGEQLLRFRQSLRGALSRRPADVTRHRRRRQTSRRTMVPH